MAKRKKAPELTFQLHIADFLIRVPKRDAEEGKPERPAFTILPRYHQSRMVRKVAGDAVAHFCNALFSRPCVKDTNTGSLKRGCI